ncbi:unnamed protein product [Soboliphyme baturini]|uniref:Uncharacterized protein n=1 Tax=Soboliphyme baturini TaxID=241478 RepID=A0A3P8E905_9BILA|nr:unnamed protein product [Soboliphyme baturini]
MPTECYVSDDELERKLSGYFTSIFDFDQSSFTPSPVAKEEEQATDEDTKLQIDVDPQVNPIMFRKSFDYRRPGRGRPKLLGDEIDNRLMLTLLKIKKDGIHITPSVVAFVVRRLLSTHRHGLLKEEGGEFEVRLAWVRCVMNRFAKLLKDIFSSSMMLGISVSLFKF